MRKRISLISLWILSLVIPSLMAQESNQSDYPMGVFNFDFARLGADETSQVNELQAIGYGGMTMRVNTNKNLEKLKRYQAAIGDAPFKIYAGFFTVFFDKDLTAQNAHLDKVIKALKQSDSKLWIILRVKGGLEVKREQIVDFLRSAAERAKAAGVELVIYPHWSGNNPLNVCLIESAEDALSYINEIQSDNLFVSLHLCHEIKAGNGDRLNEVAAKIEPWLRLPSINGADNDAVHEEEGWERGIQPLTMGDYDASKLLKALKSVDYKGPVILHTWGLQKSAPDHHHTSFKRFQEMVDAISEDGSRKNKAFKERCHEYNLQLNNKIIMKDINVKTSQEFELPAATIWNLIAGFNTLPDYHASVPKSRLSKEGNVRYLTISEDAGGGTVVERLVNLDDEAMSFSYKIIELIDCPMPFRDYQAWVKIEPTGKNSCKLHWNSSFNVEGSSKKEAEELARVIYQGCYDGITRVLVTNRSK